MNFEEILDKIRLYCKLNEISERKYCCAYCARTSYECGKKFYLSINEYTNKITGIFDERKYWMRPACKWFEHEK